MPRYFITSDDGSGPKREPDLVDFPDEKSATDDAQLALADMAGEILPNGRHAVLTVKLNDEAGEEVYRASMTIETCSAAESRAAAAAAEQESEEVASAIVALIQRL